MARRFFNWGAVARPKHGILPPPQVAKTIEISQPKPYECREFLHQKYTVERLSTKEIGRLTFSSRPTILKYLKQHGIPIRGSGKVLRKRAGFGLAYGRRIVNRREVAHQRQQEAIEKMRALRDQGFSYWKIADVFNSMKVPTQTGRGQWHARSIQAIITRNNSGDEISTPKKYLESADRPRRAIAEDFSLQIQAEPAHCK